MFPLSLTLCAAFFWRLNPLIFQGASLILGLSDGLAGLIGENFGRNSYQVTGPKTVEGSLTFFVITLIILLTMRQAYRGDLGFYAIITIIAAALLLTFVEGALSLGWDNLAVPLAAGFVVYFLLG